MQLKPIGIIHSPYKTRADAPRQGGDKISEIEIHREYEDGLKDIEGFSHIHIIYWLHDSSGFSLSVTTPWDTTPHGLFATRSPNRPNPVGYSVIELLERNGNILKVRGLDATEGTPVIDIKPYVAKIDARPDSKGGWIENRIKS